jgi:hypothetical protein
MTLGRLSTFVSEVGTDDTGLGRWSWVYVGGGGKTTHLITAYQPCGTSRRATRGETVWDQHVRYFEASGKVRNPRQMFAVDLLSLLQRWKDASDEIVLMRNLRTSTQAQLRQAYCQTT